MKKLSKKLLVYPMVLVAFASGIFVTSCSNKPGENSLSSSEDSSEISSVEKNVVISKTIDSVTIESEIIFKYDYTSLFTITVNNESIPVTTEMVDSSRVINKAGTYDVICTYMGKTEIVKVSVNMTTTVVIKAKVDTLEIKLKDVEEYDFLSLFTVTEKNRPVSVNSNMITSNVEAKEGNYQVTCAYKGVSKIISVTVTSSYKIEIFESYHELELTLKQLETFDYTSLFSLYVDGVFTKVTDSMIDATSVVEPQVGSTFNIVMSHQIEESKAEKTTTIKIVDEKEIIVSASNLVIYPNGKTVDLTSLFEISEGGETVAVTQDMISGHIDYDTIGNNEIILTYKGVTKISNVEVKKGVNIQYATSDRIIIRQNTNQATYNFANDFIVSVNGVKFNLSNDFVDVSDVDFSAIGEYEATITIPYGENEVIDGNSELVDKRLTITYVVSKDNAEIKVRNENIVLPSTTTSYDYLKNITATINGKMRTVTDNREWASDPLCTYVEIVSEPVDFSKAGIYLIEAHAYAYGLDQEPIVVTYTITVDSGIEIIESDKTTLFTGENVYPKDFFTVTKNGEEVEITNDMVEGKVDSTTPGVYTLTLNYENEKATIDVVVLSSEMKGTYSTAGMTIVEISSSSSDSSTDEEYGESTGEDVEEEVIEPEPLGKLIIDETGVKTLNGVSGTSWSAIDENTITFKLSGFEYFLHYEEGVITCEPVNDTRMKYTEHNRPFVYFKDDMWSIEDSLTINSGLNHVFASSSVCESIDLVKVKNLKDNTIMWYGFRYKLIERYNSDFFYTMESGIFNEPTSFEQLIVDNTYKINFLNKDYTFKLETESLGKMIKEDTLERIYSNKTFTGTIDGKESIISFDEHQKLTLTIDGEEELSVGFTNYYGTKIGDVNYETNTIKIYSEEEGYSYIFTFDVDTSTFIVKEKEHLFGLFKASSTSGFDSTTFFFDGYGNGVAGGLDSTSTYARNAFSYEQIDGVLYIDFVDVRYTFEYFDGITFRIDSFENVIKVVSSKNQKLINVDFVNQFIIDGAYVSFNNTLLNMHESLQDSIDELYSYIDITTKDGVVSNENKAQYIDYSYVDFDQAGFYSVGIKTTVDGEEVYKYYGIQILEPKYLDHILVGEYLSTSDSKYTFKFDVFGNATLSYYNNNNDRATYKGAMIFVDETTFTFTGICEEDDTKTVTVNGVIEADGVVSLTVKGNKELISYFYASDVESKVVGLYKYYIRAFTKNDSTSYFFITNVNSVGEKVNLVSLNNIEPTEDGAIVTVFEESGEELLTAKIAKWNDTYSGLQLADDYKGTYVCDSSENLILDGFGVSEKKLGEAIIGATSYNYYNYTDSLIKLLDKSTSEVVGYAIVSLGEKTYSLLTNEYGETNMTGSFGVISHNAISTSDHNLVLDEFGVGYYINGATSEDDSSDSEYGEYSESEDDYSTSSTTSGEYYYGRIVSFDGTKYTFVGQTNNTTPVLVTIEITKLDDYFGKMNVISEEFPANNVYIASNYESTVDCIGNNRSNYISKFVIGGQTKYFYFETSDSALKIATITIKNDIDFGDKGSIFSLAIGTTTIIEEAMCTESSMSTTYGYVYPNELKGTFAGSSGDLVLDGFSSVMFDIDGNATLNNRSRVYRVFCDNIIEVDVSTRTYVYKLNLENMTYERVSENYTGSLKGTFTQVNSTKDIVSLVFDGYSRATYTTSGGYVYNCIVEHNATTNEFSLYGDKVNDIYGDTLQITGKLIAPGILKVDANVNDAISSVYFTFEGYTSSIYSSLTSTEGTIYKVVGTDSSVNYIYAPTNKTTLDEVVTIKKESDSTFDLEEPGCIFSVNSTEGIVLVAKYDSSSLEGGYILANLDERISYTNEEGNSTLFTDGFALSSTSRGNATLDGINYTYYYNHSLENTIVLYDNLGNIAFYAEYNGETFDIIEPTLNENVFNMNAYRKLESPNYLGGNITFDSFGYFAIENYQCKANFDENITSFTFAGSDGTYTIEGTGRILEKGLLFLSYSSKNGGPSDCAYYSSSETIYSAGDNSKNIIYSVELNGTTKYLFSQTITGNDITNHLDYVNVVVETDDLPFGTIGSIFKVYTLDNEFIVRGKWKTGNGNMVVGYTTSDEYFGTYTNDELDTLTLDGFNTVIRSEESGTYMITSDNKLMVTFNGVEEKYNIDITNKTYEVITLDNFANKEFNCYQIDMYMGNIVSARFIFDGTGGVRYYTNCSDSGYYAFWNAYGSNGILGTYSISGNIITMKFPGDSSYVKNPEFTFEVDDVNNPTKLTSLTTNFAEYFSGYIAPGTIFNL